MRFGNINMKCHYVYTKKHGRILIPGCMSVASGSHISQCTCHAYFDLEEKIKDMEDTIKDLEKENKKLHKLIKEFEG